MAQLDRKKIVSNGWRQGAVVYAKQVREADPELGLDFQDTDLAILISHDCDIVHSDAANEPAVEWLHVRQITKRDGRFLYGKNPRRLHFEHEGRCYEATGHWRFTTPRAILVEFSAGSIPALSKKLTGQLAAWIAKRYDRAAFPDEFNKRVGNKRVEIANVIDKTHEFLRSILISVQPATDELTADQAYTVSLFGVMAQQDYDAPDKREPCQTVISEIENLLSSCDGINVEDCMLRSDKDISLADLDYLVEWDFDYLTVADESGGDKATSS